MLILRNREDLDEISTFGHCRCCACPCFFAGCKRATNHWRRKKLYCRNKPGWQSRCREERVEGSVRPSQQNVRSGLLKQRLEAASVGGLFHSRTSYSKATPSGSFSSNHFSAASVVANTLTRWGSPRVMNMLEQLTKVAHIEPLPAAGHFL
jgi:hypothetical protein